MSAEKVGAGDTAEARTEGLVRCAECLKARKTGVGRVYCKVFCMVIPVGDESRLCTAFRPVTPS